MQRLGVRGVAHCLVEVNHTVEHRRGAYPFVQCLASVLVCCAVVRTVLKRSDGGAEDIDAFGMCRTDYLLVNVNNVIGCLHTVLTVADVIHRLEDNNPLHALLRQQVARVTVFSRRTEATAEHAVAADAHVEHRHIGCCLVPEEAAREHVSPTVLLICG